MSNKEGEARLHDTISVSSSTTIWLRGLLVEIK